MKTLCAFLVMAVIAMPAAATKPSPPAKTQEQAQLQSQGQLQAQGQKQEANLTNVNRNDSSSYSTSGSDNSIVFEGSKIPKNTPDLSLGGLFPSAICMGVGNAGLGVQGFVIGGGKSFVDSECDKRETARSFAALGYVHAPLAILCTTKSAIEADVPECRKDVAPVAAEPTPIPTPVPPVEKVEEQKKQVAEPAGK